MLSASIWTSRKHECIDNDGHDEGNIFANWLITVSVYCVIYVPLTKSMISGIHSGQGRHREKSKETDAVRVCNDKQNSFNR